MRIQGDRIICSFYRDNECEDISGCIYNGYNLQEIIKPITPPQTPIMSVEEANTLFSTYIYTDSIETRVRKRVKGLICHEIYKKIYDSVWGGLSKKFKMRYKSIYREAFWAYMSSLFPTKDDRDKVISDLWKEGWIAEMRYNEYMIVNRIIKGW